MPTTVIHIKNAPLGWKDDPQFVYIGRGSKWGNPYRIGDPHPVTGQAMTRDDVCVLYEERTLPGLLSDIGELVDKTLVCYCAPERCHGHSWEAAANGWTTRLR